ncbi:MAG: DedA family protein [Aeromicrobium erythreum]
MIATLGQVLTGYLMAFAESGLGVGMVLPGETVVVVLAAAMPNAWAASALFVAVALGATSGDHLGYWIGRRSGDRLRGSRIVRRIGVQHYDRATDLLRRRGPLAIVATRLLPVVRTIVPAVAGASGLTYRRFLPASLAGSVLWSALYVGGGTAAARAWHAGEHLLGRASWLILLAAAVVLLPPLLLRRVLAVRPPRPAPEVARWELDGTPRPRRAPWSPLIGDVQLRPGEPAADPVR